MSEDWQFDADRLLPDGADAYPEGAREFVETAYRASLHLEEGQQLRFTCALVNDDANVPFQARLTGEPEATVQRLRKLGVAMAPGLGVLVVRAAARPVLAGICSHRAVQTILPRYLSPPPLVVSVRGLGEVRVDHGVNSLVFSRDRYVEPTTDNEVLSLIWTDVGVRLVQGVEPKSNRLFAEFSTKEGFTEDYTQNPDPAPWMHRQVARNLRSLAKAIQGLGGGGSVLLVPNAEKHPAEVCDKNHKLAPPAEGEPCEEWSGSVMEVLALDTITPRVTPHRPKPNDPVVRHMLDTHRYADEEIQQTACLALADGALILCWMFTPLAVGAKFKTGDPAALSQQVRDFLRDREKGMRHRSMAIAVNAIKGAVGLVVSSDGDCTLFGNRNGNVAVDLVL